jgi:hypothetical protein
MCHLLPFGSRFLKASTALFLLALPTANSMLIMGRPIITRKNRYISTKYAPPF